MDSLREQTVPFNFILEFRTVHISLGVANPFTNPVGEKESGDRGWVVCVRCWIFARATPI